MEKNTGNWKKKFGTIIDTCQGEIKKTTQIGMKMIGATKTNSQIREAYEDLGRLIQMEMKKGNLEWKNTDALSLLDRLETLEKELENLEGAVQDIKNDSKEKSK